MHHDKSPGSVSGTSIEERPRARRQRLEPAVDATPGTRS